MVVNGVTFIERQIKKLTEDEFVKRCINVHWQEESKEVRLARLRKIYRLINGGGEG